MDEPEFIEMFDFVISLGAEKIPYVPAYLRFCELFVNQKKRALRLNAFTTVNKIDNRCPRVKVAVLKRAYRKTPSYGYCPSPEPSWCLKTFAELEPLENVLHYFHVEAKAAVADLFVGDNERHQFLANVDCAATEAFLAAPAKKARSAILEACHKYYAQLEASTKPINPSKGWMVFTAPVQPKAVGPPKQALAPKLLEFDVSTGTLLNAQQEKQKDDKIKRQIHLPWRAWLKSDATLRLGEQKADEDAIMLVLRLLHKEGHTANEYIDVIFDEEKIPKG